MSINIVIFFLFLINYNNTSLAKDPRDLINEIVNEAASILSSEDPVESKIIKLNAIAEKSVDINGIGMYTLGKYRKSISEKDKSKYQKLFNPH